MGGAAQDPRGVVGALDAAVAGSPGGVVGQDLVGPGDEGVDGVVVLGQFAGPVGFAEPPGRVERALVVTCGAGAVGSPGARRPALRRGWASKSPSRRSA